MESLRRHNGKVNRTRVYQTDLLSLSGKHGYRAGLEMSATLQYAGLKIHCFPPRSRAHLRTFKPAFSSRLPALITHSLGGWVAFDLFLTTSQTCKRKSLSGSASLGDAPIGIDGCAINRLRAIRSVRVYETQPLSIDHSFIHHCRPHRRLLGPVQTIG
jgi:hypothetical protein